MSPGTGTIARTAPHRPGTSWMPRKGAHWRTWWLVSHGTRTWRVRLPKTAALSNGLKPSTYGHPPRGWNQSHPPNRVSQREDSRIIPSRFGGSNRSGGAINIFSWVRNSTLTGVNILPSPINKHQISTHGLSRNSFRRSNRSRTHSREKSGESGGYRDYSAKKNLYGADRASHADVSTLLRRSPQVWHP